MSSPLPVNAKNYQPNADGETEDSLKPSSVDRAASTARLGVSPVPQHVFYGSSPARSTLSVRTYGSTTDLERESSNQSGLLRTHSTTAQSVDLPEEQIAKVVKRHLVDTSQEQLTNNDDCHSDHSTGITSVHQLPGGSITHEIYRWTEAVQNEQHQRKRSRSVVITRQESPNSSLAHLKNPGGFRRHFVVNQAERQGKQPPNWMTHSFMDFLALYGHFGGEDLRDDEDEQDGIDEESPLIPPDALPPPPQGSATPAKAVFLLLKSFVGTGVMFLPKAFYNGGVFFSSTLLTAIAVISLYSFLLLVETRNKVPASFGDIGGILFGPAMRMGVLFAITLSQIGFVCAYMVFVAQNMQALVESLSHCEWKAPMPYLIFGQVIIFVPLAMIRKIQKLSGLALVADVFILIGLAYLYYYDILTLAIHGIGDVQWLINPTSFPMFIGTAVFTYEGVGLVIPITESMREPEKFPKVLSWTMLFITALFLSVGFISYLAFGSNVQTVILLNLPATPAVDVIQGLYALAICLSIPLQLFPAIRIMENGLFTRSGKHDSVVKWQKNGFRLVCVLICAAVAVAGSGDLDKFVSLIGSVCCVPLCFLFPPLFHLKGVASTFRQRFLDVAIIVFGLVSMTYTTYITISLWSTSNEAPPISRCISHGN